MKRYDIAKELNVDPTTISRDTAYLVAQSQSYLHDLAKETLPFMYQTSIEGIRDVIKESWNIYQSTDKSINWYHKLAALKLIKESNEGIFNLLDKVPSVLFLKQLYDKLILIQNGQGSERRTAAAVELTVEDQKGG
jgi:hypothetical protein